MADNPPESGTRLTAVEIHDNILEPAEKEMDRGGTGRTENLIDARGSTSPPVRLPSPTSGTPY
jgi:hypothetical protein